MTQRPHLLLIALFFPPSRASGVFRPLAMANYFATQGWRVTVITVTPEFFDDITGSSDSSLEDFIDKAVTVERVPLPAGHLQTDVRKLSWIRVNFPKPAAHWDTIRGKFFPDRYTSWIPGVVRRALRVHRRQRIDVTLATGNPWSAFEAARLISKVTRTPYVLDYRDSWTLSQFSESEAFGADHPAQQAERRVIDDAGRVVFVNEPMRAWHAAKYPEAEPNMMVLENGYDPELVPSPPFRVPDAAVPLRFGSVGTITEHWPHDAAWPGWILARNHPELTGATAHLYGHLGFFPAAAERIKKMLPPASAGITWEGAVPKAQLTAVYGSLDVIIMPIPSSRYVTAGKVYECMATGKPIVAIHSPETAASDPLRGYPLWFPVHELTADAVEDALVAGARAARAVTEDQYREALAHASKYTRHRLLQPFEKEIRGLLDVD